ncbi:3-hydroxyacyl-CoA dehydrogenase family protein, partial [Roseomonas sp. DSM 102946]|nr:3-hydroxyacyl-CoA dehydrogenase family protein [Roseomonas sp. DSM 102946]
KRELYARLDGVMKPGAVLSSNTSTIPLQALAEGMPAERARHFLITHFFNPPRYMRLLEVVAGPRTDTGVLATIRETADRRLGKTVVVAKDTPGFIANRIGTLWMQSAVNHATELRLSVEEADAVAGRPMGVPRTGVFGLLDLVGLDLMPHVSRSLLASLPEGDAYRALHREHPVVAKLIESGRTGRKSSQGGFYTRAKDAGGKSL